MKKFIVETYYTCIFKTVHTLNSLNDQELSQKIGNKARQLVVEKFNWDILAKRFVEVVEPSLTKNVKQLNK